VAEACKEKKKKRSIQIYGLFISIKLTAREMQGCVEGMLMILL